MDDNTVLKRNDAGKREYDRRHVRTTLGRRRFLRATGAGIAAVATTGAASAAPSSGRVAELFDGKTETIEIDYGAFDGPAAVYDVTDNRSGIPPAFVSSPTVVHENALRLEFADDSKAANLEFRFENHDYEAPREVYTRFHVYPDGITLEPDDTVRIFWAPLTNGTGSSGGGHPDGTNGWSNAIGFAHRNDSPAPDGYKFFSYSYHMDKTTDSGDFEMTDAVVRMDEWNEIECYIRVNSFSGGTANADGVMRYWVNGELAYERTDLRFTTSEDNLIEGLGPLGYVISDDQAGNALLYDGHEVHVAD